MQLRHLTAAAMAALLSTGALAAGAVISTVRSGSVTRSVLPTRNPTPNSVTAMAAAATIANVAR